MVRRVLVQNRFLAEVARMLSEGCSVKVRIDGESMYPFIRGGSDEVELLPYATSQPLKRWECALFKWKGRYMVHRCIDIRNGMYRMMGDGNLAQIEEVPEDALIGILNTIYHPDGTTQDCRDVRWLVRGRRWYRWCALRRFLIPIFRRLGWGECR